MSLKPGPELDRLVAKALGWRKDVWPVISISPRWVRPGVVNVTLNDLEFSPPPFSTDPGEAIKALIAFKAKWDSDHKEEGELGWEVNCYENCRIFMKRFTPKEEELAFGVGMTLEGAICRAIVEAAGGER